MLGFIFILTSVTYVASIVYIDKLQTFKLAIRIILRDYYMTSRFQAIECELKTWFNCFNINGIHQLCLNIHTEHTKSNDLNHSIITCTTIIFCYYVSNYQMLPKFSLDWKWISFVKRVSRLAAIVFFFLLHSIFFCIHHIQRVDDFFFLFAILYAILMVD